MLFNYWDRMIIREWDKYPLKFNDKPFVVTQYEYAFACRNLKRELFKALRIDRLIKN